MLKSHQNLHIQVDKVKMVRLVGWLETCVDMKTEVEETVQSQESSHGKQSGFGSWMLSDQ